MFKHLLETFTIIIVCWMFMVLVMFLTFGQLKAFKVAKEYCEDNSAIIEKTGEIEYYGILVAGQISMGRNSDGSADLTFTIIGENGNFSANANLIKYNNIWKVIELKIQE